MTTTYLLWILRVCLGTAPVWLSVASLSRPELIDRWWYWPTVFAAFALSVFSGVTSASTETPAAWLQHGLRALYPRGSLATHRAQRLMRGATRSVKILDTYWGASNQFRAPIQDLLQRSSATVKILLATSGGCVAKIRDSAMPGEVAVDGNLDACLSNIDGLLLQLEKIDKSLASRVEVRRYDAIVMGPLIIVDDEHVIAGTYLQSAGSPMTPAFEFSRTVFDSGEVVNQFVTTFDRIWLQAKP
jgi:hypothetical protein